MKKSVLAALLKANVIVLFIFLLTQCKSSPFGTPNSWENNPNYGENGNRSRSSQTEDENQARTQTQGETNLPVTEFGEIWGYVVAGREAALTRGLPLTDVAYFGAEVDSYGSLTDVPRRSNLNFPARIHLAVACNSRSLTHFVLLADRPERRALINQLLDAARNYDGLQIDFENIPARDGDAFVAFLAELRAGLKDKMFTIALPARTRKVADDVYDYEKIKPYVDRILIMAYDEHWSGSEPGPVASMDWCRRVAEYTLRVIGPEKLIMGLPFYGRAWGDYSPSRALIYSTIEGIMNEKNVTDISRENEIPVFRYNQDVSIVLYFEDEYSLSARMEMYKSMNVRSIGFWRIGQETLEVWNILKLSN
jgi:spore germination protein YaaH